MRRASCSILCLECAVCTRCLVARSWEEILCPPSYLYRCFCFHLRGAALWSLSGIAALTYDQRVAEAVRGA